MNKRSCRLAVVLALTVSLMPLQPISAASWVPNPYLGPGSYPSPIFTLEVESLAEIACLFGVITVAHVAYYLYLKQCFEQAKEKRIQAKDSTIRYECFAA